MLHTDEIFHWLSIHHGIEEQALKSEEHPYISFLPHTIALFIGVLWFMIVIGLEPVTLRYNCCLSSLSWRDQHGSASDWSITSWGLGFTSNIPMCVVLQGLYLHKPVLYSIRLLYLYELAASARQCLTTFCLGSSGAFLPINPTSAFASTVSNWFK